MQCSQAQTQNKKQPKLNYIRLFALKLTVLPGMGWGLGAVAP